MSDTEQTRPGRAQTEYVVLASTAGDGEWAEHAQVAAQSREAAVRKVAAGMGDGSPALFKAVPAGSWKTIRVAVEPQPAKLTVREVED